MAAVVFALAVIPTALPVLSNNALDRADRLDEQGRIDEARVEADLAAALNHTSVDAQLQRASLLQALGRPADARRAVNRALALAPKDSRTWLALAGYQRYCWNDPRLAGEHRPRTRVRGPRHGLRRDRRRRRRGERRLRPLSERLYVPRMMTSLARPACPGVMPSSGVTNCTLPRRRASLRAAGP